MDISVFRYRQVVPFLMEQKDFHYEKVSEAKFLSNQNDLDPSGRLGIAGDQQLIADASLTLAVGTLTGYITGRIQMETLHIHGRCHSSRPLYCVVQRVHRLVHAGDDDNAVGAIDDSSHTVAVTVNVHHFSIQAQAIGAGQKEICVHAAARNCFLLLGCFALRGV